eukprot:NODE_5514_length_644_cov_224.179884_g5350_i0.p1 GENE.NODE_5514_length_644_cov_224.179884_g5350_i0~~NODE_5514_length_644_cov_224.179884_g5350_i0.p1  ORF type:complete len:160 (-),score=25.41 NODE_5514_length_644_cov_224.179884_g5350_i0:79-558(-)
MPSLSALQTSDELTKMNAVMDPFPNPISLLPLRACGFTRGELMGLLEKSGYGRNSDAFNAYFVPGSNPHSNPEILPRCKKCSKPIDEHQAAAAGETTTQELAEAAGSICGAGECVRLWGRWLTHRLEGCGITRLQAQGLSWIFLLAFFFGLWRVWGRWA